MTPPNDDATTSPAQLKTKTRERKSENKRLKTAMGVMRRNACSTERAPSNIFEMEQTYKGTKMALHSGSK